MGKDLTSISDVANDVVLLDAPIFQRLVHLLSNGESGVGLGHAGDVEKDGAERPVRAPELRCDRQVGSLEEWLFLFVIRNNK